MPPLYQAGGIYIFSPKGEPTMFNRLIENWQTSVAGLLLGIGNYLTTQSGQPWNWESFGISIGAILLGLLSKK